MKRSNPSSGKKTHIPSDFKRLKAKVGKRAPQKVNATETKFRTASIQVRSQNITRGDSKIDATKGDVDHNVKHSRSYDMVSSKGKQLSQLLSQLNNTSSNARLSALQGIKDAAKHVPSEILCNYLSVLVAPLSKSMVDEDSKIRKMARSLFFQDFSLRILNNNDSDKMRPFLPLSIAYIASALHSLDQDIRYDGCVALENLCTSFGKELNGDNELHTLFKTIPAFAILFEDVGGGIASVSTRGVGNIELLKHSKSSGKNQNNRGGETKNKKRQSKGSDKAIGVLKSFISIMKVTSLSGQEELDVDKTWLLNSDSMKRLSPNGSALLPSLTLPHLKYLPGGSSTNAIVLNLNERREQNRPSKIRLKDMREFSNMLKRQEANKTSEWTNKALSGATQIDLLSKLRNRLVEVTQNGHHQSDGGLSISSHEVQECMLLVSALRLLWNCHPNLFGNEDEAKTKECKKFTTLANHMLQLQLDIFPIQDPSGNEANKSNYDVLNASLCCAISEFGSVLDPSGANVKKDSILQAEWINTIFSYLIPQLSYDDDDGTIITNSTGPTTSSNSKVTLMKVLEQLLFRRETGVYFLEDEKKRLELLSTISKVFFPDVDALSVQMCCSIEGRRAVYILLSMINQYFRFDVQSDFSVDNENEYWRILSQMALKLPSYVIIWRGNHVKDSSLIFSTLLSIVRRCKVPSASKFCNALRQSMTDLFTTGTKTDSVFEELYSITPQKLAISLVGVLSYPSKALVLSLAQICAKYNATNQISLDDDIVDYIMSVVYSIKETMSIELYSEFLIESIGFSFMDLVTNNEDETESKQMNGNKQNGIGFLICKFDVAIARSCRYLCLELHDNDSLLQVLSSTLMSWLREADGSPLYHQMKARAAIVIISCWTVLIGHEIFLSDQDLKERILMVVCNFYLSSAEMFNDDNHQLISPLMVSVMPQSFFDMHHLHPTL